MNEAVLLPADADTASPAPRALLGGGDLWIAGAITFALFPLAWLLRRAVGLDAAEYAVGFTTFYGAYVVNDPHFAVTYVLFYKNARRRAFDDALPAAQRARYLLAGFVAPLALAAWAAYALVHHAAQSLGWMIQLMFLLVGWHYVKQGFGVFALLAARRGFHATARERTALLFHCYAGWAFAWANPATVAGVFEEKGIVYWTPAHPRLLELATGAALAVSTIALVAVLVAAARARRRIPVGPLAVFLVTIWSWSIYSSVDPLMRYVIPALHSIQYLYVVWLLRRNEARAEEGPPTFGRPVAVRVGGLAIAALALGWLLFHGAPALLDGTLAARPRHSSLAVDAMGETPYFAAIFVFVNIHHYLMDAVIWRRENPETRWLRGA